MRDPSKNRELSVALVDAGSPAALGIAQIVSWGTLFYAISVLGPPMGRALIDARGGRFVLSENGTPNGVALTTNERRYVDILRKGDWKRLGLQ